MQYNYINYLLFLLTYWRYTYVYTNHIDCQKNVSTQFSGGKQAINQVFIC